MREIFKSGSVRGLIATLGLLPQKKVRYGLYSTVRRVLRLFQPLLGFSGASAFSVCSAVKFKDIAISLEKSTVSLCWLGGYAENGQGSFHGCNCRSSNKS
ncbi:hypothetical protein C5S35_16485 [Candidatus Methanophagaceae archaeon]|nr:hypothetical protein C5S35_16485 [Methanophagales archaeon]